MNTFTNQKRLETLESLRRQHARQEEELAVAFDSLRALGNKTLSVPREQLQAIHTACLVPVAALQSNAVRA